MSEIVLAIINLLAYTYVIGLMHKGGLMVVRRIDSHWRDSGRSPRFFGIDARSTFPLLLFLLHIRLWTFVLATVVTVFFGMIEHYGFSTVVFLRLFRTMMAGKRKIVKPWWREERFR